MKFGVADYIAFGFFGLFLIFYFTGIRAGVIFALPFVGFLIFGINFFLPR